jgi:hypothetical protein
MRIRVGCEMTYELGQVTPMIAILNVHSSRVSDLERPDYLITTPSVPVEVSTAVQKSATGRRKTGPVAGVLRHGGRADHIAGACHGALAPWANCHRVDFRTMFAVCAIGYEQDGSSRRSSRGC